MKYAIKFQVKSDSCSKNGFYSRKAFEFPKIMSLFSTQLNSRRVGKHTDLKYILF